MVNNSKIPVPQIIEATISKSPSRGDWSKLLPFQKKKLEKYLNEYHSVLMDNNQILMSIFDKFDKMKKKIK